MAPKRESMVKLTTRIRLSGCQPADRLRQDELDGRRRRVSGLLRLRQVDDLGDIQQQSLEGVVRGLEPDERTLMQLTRPLAPGNDLLDERRGTLRVRFRRDALWRRTRCGRWCKIA